MLINFKVSNYRSFENEIELSMNSSGLQEFKESILIDETTKVLPAMGIYGKNGAGKSNVIRAFWLATQFIKNAQRTQHESAQIPMTPFLLNDKNRSEPTTFEFTYKENGIKYIYGFSANNKEVVKEYLHHAPKGQMTAVFERKMQNFKFSTNGDKKIKELISGVVGKNQLFFAVASTMNYEPCIKAMKWFRDKVMFSRDFNDIPNQLFEYSDNENMLKSIVSYAKEADVGIEDMTFEFCNVDLKDMENSNTEIPNEVKMAMSKFKEILSSASNASNTSNVEVKAQGITAKTFHKGIAKDGTTNVYELDLEDESDGTKKIMAMAPAIELVLNQGGIFLVDEIEKEIHPKMVEFIVSKFQSKISNKSNAQLIFTTHNTELLDMNILRKDQILFVDKDSETGASDMYNLREFAQPTNANIRKSYLVGKYGAIPQIEIEEV